MDNEKKLNVSHLLWQAVKRALYAYIQSWRTAAAAAPRIARQGVLFHIKSSTAPPHTSRFLLHLRGGEAGEKEKHVCDSFYCHVRHVLEWSWLKSRRRGRESLRVFQALGCITTSAMTRLLTTWEILSLLVKIMTLWQSIAAGCEFWNSACSWEVRVEKWRIFWLRVPSSI